MISEQSLLTDWLYVLSTSFPCLSDHEVDLGLELFRTHSAACRAASFGVFLTVPLND